MPVDPWQPPVPRPRHDSSVGPDEQDDVAIWLDELQAPALGRQTARSPTRATASLDIAYQSHEFEPQARQRPWHADRSASERQQSHARRKAASLVVALEISHDRDRAAALAFLTGLLEDFPHPTTHQALAREIEAGADLDTLRAMGELKRLWLVTPAWWLRRQFCRMRRELEFVRDRQGPHGLSWRLARRISEARWRWPVEAMVAEAWLDEWRALPFALHGCWSFAQFLDWRLDRDPDDDRDLIAEAPPHDLRPGPLMWQQVAASAVPLADLSTTKARSEPGQLQ